MAAGRTLPHRIVFVALILLSIGSGCQGGTDDEGPRWLNQWIRRAVVRLQRPLLFETGIDVLWGSLTRAAAPTSFGYLAGTGMSVLSLVPSGVPGELVMARKLLVGSSVHSFVVDEPFAYLAAGQRGLVTLEWTNAGDVHIVDESYLPGYAIYVAQTGGHLLVACKDGGGITIFRKRKAGMPEPVRHLAEGMSLAHIQVHGDHAFAVGSEKLLVIDIRRPEEAQVVSDLWMPYQALPRPTDPMPRRVALHPPYAYVANGAHGIVTIDLGDPEKPQVAGIWPDSGFADWVMVHKNAAYVASEATAIRIADLSDPLAPRWMGDMDFAPKIAADPSAGSDETPLPIARGAQGVAVMDASDPLHPRALAAYSPAPFLHRVSILNFQAYAAAASGGVQVYSLDDPTHPRLIGALATHGHTRDVRPVGNRLWIADTVGWLLLADPIAGAIPRIVSRIDKGGHPWAFELIGNRAYIADSQAGLTVLRRTGSTIEPPFEVVAQAPAGGYSLDVAVKPPYVYIATIGNGVVIFKDQGDAVEMVGRIVWPTLGPFSIMASATAVTLDGHTLYVGDAGGRVLAYDLTDPAPPEREWTRRFGGPIFDIVLGADGLWVTAGSDGVFLLDPQRHRAKHHFTVPGTAMSAVEFAGRLLVAAGEAGLVSLPLRGTAR